MRNPNDDKQPNGNDDREPASGNPGNEQNKNMPGQGARRGDQGTTGGADGRNPKPGAGRQH